MASETSVSIQPSKYRTEYSHPAAAGKSWSRVWPGLCAVGSLAAIALFVIAIPARIAQIQAPSSQTLAAQHLWGITPVWVAVYLGTIEIGVALAFVGIGVLIALHQPRDPMGWLTSLGLVLTGVTLPPTIGALSVSSAVWDLPAALATTMAAGLGVLFCYTFPDGRFVPRWTRPLSGLLLGGLIALAVVSTYSDAVFTRSLPVWVGVAFGLYATGIVAQAYRYRYISTFVERQQSKWLLFGLDALLLNFVLLVGYFYIPMLWPGDDVQELYTLALYPVFYGIAPLALLLSIAAAILRYRLWDIDVVLNRSLVWGALSWIVVSGYVISVAALAALFHTTFNWWMALIATGVIALLFQPIHHWLQRQVNRRLYGAVDEPHTVLRRLGQTLKEGVATEEWLPRLAETIARSLKLPYVGIVLIRGDRREVVAEYAQLETRTRHSPEGTPLRLPLIYRAETLGELILAPRSGQALFSPTEDALLRDIAREAGLIAHSLNTTRELKQARADLVHSREAERLRLQRDLHDGLSPTLASLALQMETARDLVTDQPALAQTLLTEMAAEARTAFVDLRTLVHNLRPPELDEVGLLGVIHRLAHQVEGAGVRVTLNLPERLPPLPDAVSVAAYRIMQEALTNVQRHAQAHQCYVHVSVDSHWLALDVYDDGQGLPDSHQSGVGLHSMRQRAEELGGSFHASLLAKDGTGIQVQLPLSRG